MPESLDTSIYPASQRVRLRYIDFRLFFTGCIKRTDLMDRFSIAEAAASKDLAAYREAAPDAVAYDAASKTYFVTKTYTRTFVRDVKAVHLLRALVHGMGDEFGSSQEPLIPCELPSRLHRPHIETVAQVSRAIYAGHALEVDYLSRETSECRVLIPFSLAGNGLRWHVRAYDRRRNRFGDFVVNRIENARILPDEPVAPHERKEFDKQWNRIVELELVPHPKLASKRFVELEHGMTNGVLNHEVRAALAGYLLRLWNVDCTPDASLRGNKFGHEYQLWLRNPQTLYGVDNVHIAPGYQSASNAELPD